MVNVNVIFKTSNCFLSPFLMVLFIIPYANSLIYVISSSSYWTAILYKIKNIFIQKNHRIKILVFLFIIIHAYTHAYTHTYKYANR